MTINLNDSIFRIYGGRLNGFLYHFDIEIDAYNRFIIDVEDNIKNSELELKNLISKKIENGEDEEYVYYIHEMDDIRLFSMSNIHRNSQLISLFSFAEAQMKTLCEYVQKDNSISKTISEMKGSNFLDKGKNYINKVLGVNLDSLNTLWEKMNDFRKIRNCITHRNSNIIENEDVLKKQPLYPILSKLGFQEIQLYDFGEFRLKSNKLILDYCEIQKKYFLELTKLIDDKCYTNN